MDYNWQNTLTRGDLGKSTGFNANINFSVNFRMKQLFDPLFETKPGAAVPAAPSRGRRGSGESGTQTGAADSTRVLDSAATTVGGMDKLIGQLSNLARVLIKIPLLDYDNVNIAFTQTNSAQNSGVVGSTGFVNFWGRVPFFQDAEIKYGPSRLYQLGLISDPSGRLTNFGTRPYFPFFGWDVSPVSAHREVFS